MSAGPVPGTGSGSQRPQASAQNRVGHDQSRHILPLHIKHPHLTEKPGLGIHERMGPVYLSLLDIIPDPTEKCPAPYPAPQ